MSKIREALEEVVSILSTWTDHLPPVIQEEAQEAIDKAEAALAEPLKNCEVGTPEEQYNRFIYCCTERKISCRKTFNRGCAICYAKWMQMPYEKGGNDEQ
jgi:hypothetical protein